jgi:heme-degrading monooxygenase HmoA
MFMFARVITGQSGPDGLDGVIRFAREHLPDAQAQPGFKGFYLLTDRDTGNLVTISLWDSWEDVWPVRAVQVPSEAAGSIEVAPDPAKIYQVEIARLA